ncbi:unnamed protein product [Amoebophrya sp. A25]|nr:unnamed protein product [Amoebophrya sp. A25]|eukprot:GSA25T00017155001.1
MKESRKCKAPMLVTGNKMRPSVLLTVVSTLLLSGCSLSPVRAFQPQQTQERATLLTAEETPDDFELPTRHLLQRQHAPLTSSTNLLQVGVRDPLDDVQDEVLIQKNQKQEGQGPWELHDNTTKHMKKPGLGYSYGSPLYGESMYSVSHETYTTIPPPPAVSPSLRCILILTGQFFLIIAGVAILKTYKDVFAGGRPSTALLAFQIARATLHFVPMVCVFFLAIRLRAVHLAGGENDKFQLPPAWMQQMMELTTACIVLQTVAVLLTPLLFNKLPEVDDEGNLVVAETTGPSGVRSWGNTFILLIRTACLSGMWVGIISLQAGAWMMEPPKEIWGPRADMKHADFPWPSTSVKATLDMCSTFFFVYFLLALLKEINSPKCAKCIALLEVCTSVVALAPMFCVLFIGARMRAVQLDPLNASVQPWAKIAMTVCTGSMELVLAATMIGGCCFGGEALKGNCEGDVRFRMRSTIGEVLMQLIRWTCLVGIYLGAVTVFASILLLEKPVAPTPPVSPALRCTMILTVLYLIVYLGIFIVTSLRQCMGPYFASSAVRAFDTARTAVLYAPMLAVLFLGCRLRALQLTNFSGAPQGYAQDCMYLATWTTIVQLFSSLILGFVAPAGDVYADEDGNVKTEVNLAPGNPTASLMIKYFLEFMKYTCLLGAYGGAIGIGYAICTMTPQNADGKGHLFPWGPVPEPIDPAESVKSATMPLATGSGGVFGSR